MRVQKSAAIGGKKAGRWLLGVIKIECIVVGSKQQKDAATTELEKNPLQCGDFIMKEKQVEKFV